MVKAGLPILNVLVMIRDQIEHPTLKKLLKILEEVLKVELPYQSVLKNTQRYLIMFT